MRGSIIAALNALPSVDCSRHKAEAEKPLKHLGCIFISVMLGFGSGCISVLLNFYVGIYICYALI